ncbi:MAG: hypothetical protein HRU19_09060 [Pseudobacteriovorax sp.]|nr:hypothetical protein [Pseudobacteriovorax sp.]
MKRLSSVFFVFMIFSSLSNTLQARDFLEFFPETNDTKFVFSEKNGLSANPPSQASTGQEAVPEQQPPKKTFPPKTMVMVEGDRLIIDLDQTRSYDWSVNNQAVCLSQATCEIDSRALGSGNHKLKVTWDNGDVQECSYSRIAIKRKDIDDPTLQKKIQGIIRDDIERVDRSKMFLQVLRGIAYQKFGKKTKALKGFHQIKSSQIIKSLGKTDLALKLNNGTHIWQSSNSKIQLIAGKAQILNGLVLVKIESEQVSQQIKVGDLFFNLPNKSEVVFIYRNDLLQAIPLTQSISVIFSGDNKRPPLAINVGESLNLKNDKLVVRSNHNFNMIRLGKVFFKVNLIREKQKLPLVSENYLAKVFAESSQMSAEDLFLRGFSRRSAKIFRQNLNAKSKSFWQYGANLIILKDWQKLESLYEIRDESIEVDHRRYYEGVSLHLKGDVNGAYRQFKELLWLGDNVLMKQSAQRFIEYYEKDQTFSSQIRILGVNSNNVLGFNDSSEPPQGIEHRASNGITLNGNTAYQLSSDQGFKVYIKADLLYEYWLKAGLSEYGRMEISLGPSLNYTNDQSRVTARPYFGNYLYGSTPYLDRYGLKLIYESAFIGEKTILSYDHSKNLDPNAADESFLDAYTGDIVPSEDRSLQAQLFNILINWSQNWSTDLTLARGDYRFVEAEGDDFISTRFAIQYSKDFSPFSSVLVKPEVAMRQSEDSPANTTSLLLEFYLRTSVTLRYLGQIYYKTQSSSEESLTH